MSQSDRAENRLRELRGLTLQRLQGHTPLTNRLEQAVDDASNVIVPAFTATQWRDDEHAPDPPGVVVAVSVVTASSDRWNQQEQANITVQVELEGRRDTLRTHGLAWWDELLDEISAVMTAHVEGWTAEGETGGTPEPLWSEQRGRYVSAKRFDVSRFG